MTSPEPIDLNFVTDDVGGGTWLQWAQSITNITDLVDQAIAQASGPPRTCIRHLVIAGHGATNTDGFTVFDANSTGAEYVDGGNTRNPISPKVEEQLRRLRPYLCAEAIVEFRVCRFGTGTNGERAMQLVADILGVPVTAPTDEIKSLGLIGGLATDWRTAYPTDWNKPGGVSFWRGEAERKPTTGSTQDVAPITARTVTGQFVPLPGVNPLSLTPPLTLPTPPRSGLGRKVAAGAAAGALVVALGSSVTLNRGGTDMTPSASNVVAPGTAQGAPAAAPAYEVRVSPIEAVFTQAAFTTDYSVLVTVTSPSGGAPALVFDWTGADCGTFGPTADPRTFRWVHPHPPCDASTNHADRMITLRLTAADRQFRCTYQGAASGVGPPCVDAGTGAATTPVGGGR